MKGPLFILLVILLILIGGVAGYIIGTNKYPTITTTPLTTIVPSQIISPTLLPSQTPTIGSSSSTPMVTSSQIKTVTPTP